MRTREENGVVMEAIVLLWFESPRVTSNLEKKRWAALVHYSVKNAAVLCENHRERVAQI